MFLSIFYFDYFPKKLRQIACPGRPPLCTRYGALDGARKATMHDGTSAWAAQARQNPCLRPLRKHQATNDAGDGGSGDGTTGGAK